MERELEEEAEAAAAVVRTGQGEETCSRLARTRGIDVFDVQALGNDLWVADEVAGVIRIQQRTEPERHRIPEREIAVPFAGGRGGHAGKHEQSDRREHREQPDPHPNHLRLSLYRLGRLESKRSGCFAPVAT